MFYNNLSYEIKLLFRKHWILMLATIIAVLFFFASYNGAQKVSQRTNDITNINKQVQEEDATMLQLLADIEAGKDTDTPYWLLPTSPMTIGNRHPRVAAMTAQPLAFIATGQSDLYTHYMRPEAYGNNFALDYAEMTNPVQLLFGSFDLAFVLIYILPLLIIAFTFNVLSKEKELGTLKLLGAQPISIFKWLVQKMTIRFILFTAITLLLLLISIAVFSPNGFNDISNLLGVILMVITYILFWFVVACIVNIKVNDSSKNALMLIGVWLLVVLVIPATINQASNSLYPTPSRLKMINEIRQLKKENAKKQDEILDSYLRDHPELASAGNKEDYNFWHNYFASEKVLQEKTTPLLANYDAQLQKQQNFVGIFKYISPAVLMQEALNNIAGTSENHYNNFKKQVVNFSDEWRNYIVPMLFKGEKFSKKNYDELPTFEYKNKISNAIWLNLVAIIIISGLIFFLPTGKGLKTNPFIK